MAARSRRVRNQACATPPGQADSHTGCDIPAGNHPPSGHGPTHPL